MIEVTGNDLAAADAVIESVEWQMSNFMPAKGEGGEACRSRRLHAAIAEAVRDARQQAEDAMRERCAAIADGQKEKWGRHAYVVATADSIAAAIRGIDAGGEGE